MPDYREKSSRTEAFIRWYVWGLQFKDCDPSLWCTNYLHQRYEHNIEQKLWFSWLFGNTYYLPTSWVLLNEFPDYELATVDRMALWNSGNYQRLRYQTDTKWNKGHLPDMFTSYQKFIGSASQADRFWAILSDNEETSFENLFKEVGNNLYKFGRYSTWFYLQHLKHTVGLPIEPTSLLLDDFSGSRSHRNGLLLSLGEEEKIDEKLTSMEYARLEAKASEVLCEVRIRFPQLAKEADFFSMETALCSFKKIFRRKEGRYLGYYLDRQSEEIKKCEKDGWGGIYWDVLWDSRLESLDPRLSGKSTIDKDKFGAFLDTGSMDRLNWFFEEEPTFAEKEDIFDMFGA